MGCCVSSAGWKREHVVANKFDFVDVSEFYDPSCWRRVQYSFIYIILVKSILVYVADLWTAYLLLTGSWTNDITPTIPIQYSKWIFVGCIAMSYLLLLWELRKARRIVRSRDIAYAFTNIIASRYYSVLSYAHFCLFQRVDKSTSNTQAMAFFIFFRLKGWKRILLAEAPRQVINGTTMWAIFYGSYQLDFAKAIQQEQAASLSRQIAFALMGFTFCMFALSAIVLLVAFVLYIPLLCQVRGNLKEYVCHLVDKRIADLLQKNKKRRMIEHQKWQAKRAASAAGSSSGKSRKKSMLSGLWTTRQPTLPKIDDIDEVRTVLSHATSRYPPPPPPPQSSSVVSTQSIMRNGAYAKFPPTPPYGQAPSNNMSRPPTAGSETSGYASSSNRTFVAPPPMYAPPPVPPVPSSYAQPMTSNNTAQSTVSVSRHNPLLQQYRNHVRAGAATTPYRPMQHQAPPQLHFDHASEQGSVVSSSSSSAPVIYPEDSASEVGARNATGYPQYAPHYALHAPPPPPMVGMNHPVPNGVRMASRGGYAKVPPPQSQIGGGGNSSVISSGRRSPPRPPRPW